MRFSLASTLTGSLGSFVQRTVAGLNALVVSLVDGNFADDSVTQGQAFAGWTSQAGVAAQNAHCQLFNPAASGVFVYIDQIRVPNVGGTASAIKVLTATVALTTDGGALFNKNSGGSASLSHGRAQSNAGVLGVNTLAREVNPVNGDVVITFSPPLRIAAGAGINVANEALNAQLDVSWQWREKTT